MDKEKAIKEFLEFREECLLSRDKAIEVYTFFKYNPNEKYYTCLVNNAPIKIDRDEFWDNINTSILRDLYKRNRQEDIIEQDTSEDDIITENTKLRKQCVTTRQKLNLERNIFNKKLKEVSLLEDLNQEILDSLKKLKLVNIKSSKKDFQCDDKDVGVIVLSDLHFNELIDIASNKYDFEVASKRLRKLALESIKNLKVNKVVILGLGDFLNSDRRQAEYLNIATNRGRAVVLAFELLSLFITEIAYHFEDVTVAMVSGNESRVVGEEFDTSEEIATYNYDFTLFNMLKIYFMNKTEDVKFVDGSFGEKVLNINNSNVLITHGVNMKADVEKSVAQTFGRYANMGINLDYMFMGHLHSARIGDLYSRCGSLCGGNSYSEGALNLASRASQLIGVFHADKSNSIIKVDLQNVDGITGYDIVKDLEAYNTKSTNKKNKFLIHNI